MTVERRLSGVSTHRRSRSCLGDDDDDVIVATFASNERFKHDARTTFAPLPPSPPPQPPAHARNILAAIETIV